MLLFNYLFGWARLGEFLAIPEPPATIGQDVKQKANRNDNDAATFHTSHISNGNGIT